MIFQTFRLLEYEDELDLLAIAVTNGEGEEGSAHVQLHDNQTGRLQRKIDLDEAWDEVCNIKNLINLTYFVLINQPFLVSRKRVI